MQNWISEFLYVFLLSKKTQLALILGCVFFFGIHLFGYIALSNFELHGPLKSAQGAMKQVFADKYDKVALGLLIGFLVLACKCYLKDKKRLL